MSDPPTPGAFSDPLPDEPLYRSMPTRTLHQMREAFTGERAEAARTVTLCDMRLRLIETILAEREDAESGPCT